MSKNKSLTLKNPTEGLRQWLNDNLVVNYVNHHLFNKEDNEYLFNLLSYDGSQFTVEGTPEEIFIENFEEFLINTLLGVNEPCPDVSVHIETITKAAENTLRTYNPSVVQYGITDDEGKEIIQPVYLLTEQAYKYMLAKCTKDELWDLGFLGCDEKHIVKSKMPFNLK